LINIGGERELFELGCRPRAPHQFESHSFDDLVKAKIRDFRLIQQKTPLTQGFFYYIKRLPSQPAITQQKPRFLRVSEDSNRSPRPSRNRRFLFALANESTEKCLPWQTNQQKSVCLGKRINRKVV
jgi:hypothetical protein